MHYFQQQGKTVVGMKPVAAGCYVKNGQLKKENYDMSDAATAVIGFVNMQKLGISN